MQVLQDANSLVFIDNLKTCTNALPLFTTSVGKADVVLTLVNSKHAGQAVIGPACMMMPAKVPLVPGAGVDA